MVLILIYSKHESFLGIVSIWKEREMDFVEIFWTVSSLMIGVIHVIESGRKTDQFYQVLNNEAVWGQIWLDLFVFK